MLPTLWFRNTWSWSLTPPLKPLVRQLDPLTVVAFHPSLGDRYLYAERAVPWLYTENETNFERVFRTPNASRYVKDGINDAVVGRKREAVNPRRIGTKAAGQYEFIIASGDPAVIRLRLSPRPIAPADAIGPEFDRILQARLSEADAFYANVIPDKVTDDERLVMRQAFAGMARFFLR